MTALRIGLVGNGDAASDKLTRLLAEQGQLIVYALRPAGLDESHIAATDIDVWLFDIDDASWCDEIDALMDRSTVPVFFNEHAAINKQPHSEYWCRNLIARMQDLVNEPALLPPARAPETRGETLHIAFPSEPAVQADMPSGLDPALLEEIEELEAMLQRAPGSNEQDWFAGASITLDAGEALAVDFADPAPLSLMPAPAPVPEVGFDDDWHSDLVEPVPALTDAEWQASHAHPPSAASEPLPEATAELLAPDVAELALMDLFAPPPELAAQQEAVLVEALALRDAPQTVASPADPDIETFTLDIAPEHEPAALPLDVPTIASPVADIPVIDIPGIDVPGIDIPVSDAPLLASEPFLVSTPEPDFTAGETDPLSAGGAITPLPAETLIPVLAVETAAVLSGPEASADALAELPLPAGGHAPLPVESPRAVVPAASQLPCDLWVLGASLGGPAALKRFFTALTEPVPIGFLLAQHIDAHFLPVLGKILEQSNSFYRVTALSRPGLIEAGTLLLTPTDRRPRFLEAGQIILSARPWTPPYAPCIDDVLLDAVHEYGAQVHAIVFSGMGEDGVRGAKALRSAGGEVWVQDSESCASAVMPDAIAAAGLASARDTPEALAQRLMARYADAGRNSSRHP